MGAELAVSQKADWMRGKSLVDTDTSMWLMQASALTVWNVVQES